MTKVHLTALSWCALNYGDGNLDAYTHGCPGLLTGVISRKNTWTLDENMFGFVTKTFPDRVWHCKLNYHLLSSSDAPRMDLHCRRASVLFDRRRHCASTSHCNILQLPNVTQWPTSQDSDIMYFNTCIFFFFDASGNIYHFTWISIELLTGLDCSTIEATLLFFLHANRLWPKGAPFLCQA